MVNNFFQKHFKIDSTPDMIRIFTRLALYNADKGDYKRSLFWWTTIQTRYNEYITEEYLRAYAKFIAWNLVKLNDLSEEFIMEMQMKGYL